jgi:radical SAM protein with 4Fe4S-binding SPASM domain
VKAEIKPRIDRKNRTNLVDVLPLETPFILNVDPASSCNFKCQFCPTGHRELIADTGRFQGIMHLETFTKIIADLEEFEGQVKVLRLYKDGEPFLNKNLAKMVEMAKCSDKVECIDTTTNASLFNFERVKPVLDAGIDRINISIDGMSDAEYIKNVGTRVSFDEVVRNIEQAFKYKSSTEFHIKTISDILLPQSVERFYEIFGNICDQIFIENLAPCWPDFDVAEIMGVEFSEGIYGQSISEVKTCPYLFYSMSVNSDGTVSTCFLDWSRDLIIGDVKESTIKSIWYGERMQNYRLMHLNGQREKHKLCGSCGQLSHCWPDNIDEYVPELLALFANR